MADLSQLDLSLTTDYPADQVVILRSGSYLLPATSADVRVSIPHNLSFTPLMGGNWSFTSDFLVSYEYSTGPFNPSNPAAVFDTILNVFADSTNIYISGDNIPATPRTVYYRAYGFAPVGTDGILVETSANVGDNFVLNTDYNLPKLYLNNTVILPATGGSLQALTIDHNLGYIPQAQAWTKSNGYVFPVPSSHSLSSQNDLIIGTTGIAFIMQPFSLSNQSWYRIYLDK